MSEFASVSTSSYDPAALAAKLTEMSAEGWSVVSIVPTGGDITAFLCRDSAAEASPAAAPAASAPVVEPAPLVEPAPVIDAVVEPAPAPVAAEPAGWAVAPEPAPMAPIAEPAPVYNPAPAYTPAPVAAPAPAATPAVPAGWYADPAGRFELRYWDGGTWTEHVSRAGQQFTDAPVA
jgi:hypothetical protein